MCSSVYVQLWLKGVLTSGPKHFVVPWSHDYIIELWMKTVII